MPSGNNKFDRGDLRRDPRYAALVLDVIVEFEHYRSIDWSTGGVLLDGVCEGFDIGTAVEGWIALPGAKRAFAFSGEILRTDPATGSTVVRFDEIEDETADFLGQALNSQLH
jgi:hypothetical protein